MNARKEATFKEALRILQEEKKTLLLEKYEVEERLEEKEKEIIQVKKMIG